jgi:hypothetical protein
VVGVFETEVAKLLHTTIIRYIQPTLEIAIPLPPLCRDSITGGMIPLDSQDFYSQVPHFSAVGIDDTKKFKLQRNSATCNYLDKSTSPLSPFPFEFLHPSASIPPESEKNQGH